MAGHKACGIFLGGLLVEGEKGGEHVVHTQTYAIADGVGDGGTRPDKRYKIGAIVDERCQRTSDAEANDTPQLLAPPFILEDVLHVVLSTE